MPYQNRMLGHFSCQRKMKADYPSVAKLCTLPSASDTIPDPHGVNRDRTETAVKARTLTALGPLTPGISLFLPGFAPGSGGVLLPIEALAPKMLEMLD